MGQLPLVQIIAGLALALTFGGMTFFSTVMAPLIFTKLPFETAAVFIRQVFPWYYLTMGGTTLIALIVLALDANGSAMWETVLLILVLAGFIYARQVLMPLINRARDAQLAGEKEAELRFKRLHRTSVIINGMQWIAVLVALIFVFI